MRIHHALASATLAVAALSAHADTGGGPLDLSTGNTFFGRSNAVGVFTDTYTFTIVGSPIYIVAGTATTSAVDGQDLDFSSVYIANAATPLVPLHSFNGNLGDDTNEFYSLAPVAIAAGSYALIVTGINSPGQASYSGTLVVTTAAIPEPQTYALLLAGLAAVSFISRRSRR